MTRTLPFVRLTHVRIVVASVMVGPAALAVVAEASSPRTDSYPEEESPYLPYPIEGGPVFARIVARHRFGL